MRLLPPRSSTASIVSGTATAVPLCTPSGSNEKGPPVERETFGGSRWENSPIAYLRMSRPLCATPSGGGNHHILTPSGAAWLTESPDSIRLLGPLWTSSGLTLQAPCRLYAGDHWRSGTITATGITFALVSTPAGVVRCSDRRNLLTSTEAADFKRQTAAFRRLCKKRQGGQTNG